MRCSCILTGRMCPLHEAAPDLFTALEELMLVGSMATGFLMAADFSTMHEAVEELMGRPVFTHEMGDEFIAKEIRDKANPRFREVIAEAHLALNKARGLVVADGV